jgi:hypothetical protein
LEPAEPQNRITSHYLTHRRQREGTAEARAPRSVEAEGVGAEAAGDMADLSAERLLEAAGDMADLSAERLLEAGGSAEAEVAAGGHGGEGLGAPFRGSGQGEAATNCRKRFCSPQVCLRSP